MFVYEIYLLGTKGQL